MLGTSLPLFLWCQKNPAQRELDRMVVSLKTETIGITGMLMAFKRYGQLECEFRPSTWKKSSFQLSGGLFYIRDDTFFTLFQQKPSGFYGEDLGWVVSVAYRYMALPIETESPILSGGYIMPQAFFHRQRHVENFEDPLARDLFSDTTNSFAFGGSIGFQYPITKSLLVDASFGLGYDLTPEGYRAWIRKGKVAFFPRLSIGYTFQSRYLS